MKKFFFVLMEDIGRSASYDTFCGSFETEAEARKEAKRRWDYLTHREQSDRVITVCAGEVSEDTPLEDAYNVFDICGGYDIIETYTLTPDE